MDFNLCLLRFAKLRRLRVDALDIVNADKLVGYGLPERCYLNALEATRRYPYIKTVSGWLYSRGKDPDTRLFNEHWWNIDLSSCRYVDFSPGVDTGAAYLIDHDISAYVAKNTSTLTTHVSASVLFRDGEFYLVKKAADGSFTYKKCESLDTEVLFSFNST